jgi:hypothetical protein
MFYMTTAVFVVPSVIVVFSILLIVAVFGGERGSRRRAGMIASFAVLALILLALAFNRYLRLAWYWTQLDNPDARKRAYAVLMVGETRLKAAEPMILSAAADPSPAVRKGAMLALVSLDDPGAIDVVRAALSDGDAGVRETAVIAIVPLGRGDGRVAADLTRMLADPDPYVRDAAASGLDAIDPTWRNSPDAPEAYRQP